MREMHWLQPAVWGSGPQREGRRMQVCRSLLRSSLNKKIEPENDSCPPEITVSSTRLWCHLPFPVAIKKIQSRRGGLYLCHLIRVSHKQAILPAVTTSVTGASQQDTHTSKVFHSSGPIKHEGDSSWEVSYMAHIKASLLVVSRLHRITNTTAFYTLLCKFPVSGSNRRPARPLLDNQ